MRRHREVELTSNHSAGWVRDTRSSKGLGEAQFVDLLIKRVSLGLIFKFGCKNAKYERTVP